jgi:hypothetical protein
VPMAEKYNCTHDPYKHQTSAARSSFNPPPFYLRMIAVTRQLAKNTVIMGNIPIM